MKHATLSQKDVKPFGNFTPKCTQTTALCKHQVNFRLELCLETKYSAASHYTAKAQYNVYRVATSSLKQCVYFKYE